jgi:hypothetical protein
VFRQKSNENSRVRDGKRCYTLFTR